jgi:hypothetical protein
MGRDPGGEREQAPEGRPGPRVGLEGVELPALVREVQDGHARDVAEESREVLVDDATTTSANVLTGGTRERV